MIFKIGQTICFANWVQNKDSLSMLSIATEAFIWRNTVFMLLLHKIAVFYQ